LVLQILEENKLNELKRNFLIDKVCPCKRPA
jgi:hypothetical protein